MSSPQYQKLTDQDKDWKLKYYSFLKGAKIINVEIFEDDLFTGTDQNWPVIIIEKNGQTFELQLSRDEEGNGPGFMFGLPYV
jgi:hypothetical protein